MLNALHESGRASFDIEHQRLKPLCRFFGDDGGGDEWDTVNRVGDISESVEYSVGGGNRLVLNRNATSNVAHGLHHFFRSEGAIEAGYGFEFVNGASRVAQTTTGEHGDSATTGGESRSQHQRHFVPNSTGAVLVHDRWSFWPC